MTKMQWGVISGAVALFLVLFWGFDTKPDAQKSVEKRRVLAATSTDVSALMNEAKKSMTTGALAKVLALETEMENAPSDSMKIEAYKQLSGTWYDVNKPAIAGFYAEKLAGLAKTEEAWSIAGTTYSICVEREKEEKVRSYCRQRAIQALENAASLNPSNLQHKVNMALVYIEMPPKENPMKGILMMLELNKQYPENVLVLTQLGRLAMKTSQFEKAVQRLQQAIAIEPDNPGANCLLADAYSGLGDTSKAEAARKKCEELSVK
jgi:tetratricopeptide (TPR) repeat protein